MISVAANKLVGDLLRPTWDLLSSVDSVVRAADSAVLRRGALQSFYDHWNIYSHSQMAGMETI